MYLQNVDLMVLNNNFIHVLINILWFLMIIIHILEMNYMNKFRLKDTFDYFKDCFEINHFLIFLIFYFYVNILTFEYFLE